MTPITHIRPTDFIPHEYRMFLRTQVCTHCGAIHETSEVYALNKLRSRTGAGKFVENLVPVHRIDWNLPVKAISLEERMTPFCHLCTGVLTEIMHGLPTPTPSSQVVNTIPDNYRKLPSGDAEPVDLGKKKKPRTLSADELLGSF